MKDCLKIDDDKIDRILAYLTEQHIKAKFKDVKNYVYYFRGSRFMYYIKNRGID